ncbi:MAG: hypothetical protein ACRCSU_11885 [Paracoccaceae bacterium]
MSFFRVFPAAAAMLGFFAVPASAQEAQSLTGLSVIQGEGAAPAPITYATGDGAVSLAQVQIAQGPFDLSFPRGSCAPDQEGVHIRVHPADKVEEVLAGVNELAAMDMPSDVLRTIFQPGYGMAAEAGPVSVLYTDGSGAPMTEQGFNYFFEERFTAGNAETATIGVTAIDAGGFNLLDSGTPFVLVMGRNDCDADPKLLLDVLSVSFD